MIFWIGKHIIKIAKGGNYIYNIFLFYLLLMINIILLFVINLILERIIRKSIQLR